MPDNGRVRKYQKTHTWLRFAVDFNRLTANAWMLLGEACSKCEHIANAPLRPEVADNLYRLYLAKGVAATTAIEGNTLSEDEVRLHLEGKLRLPPSKAYLQQEVDNVARASNLIAREAIEGDIAALTVDKIRQWNRLVLEGLELEQGVVPGEIRQHGVVVMRYQGPPAEDCEYLLTRLCEWLNDPALLRPDPAERVQWGILRAVLAHLYIAWIHPFADGNGRTARLIELQVLLSAGVPMPAAHLLSNFYNETRTVYYRQLDRASASGGDVMPFIEYALTGFVDGLKGQLDIVRSHQWGIAWRDLVFRTFDGKHGVTDQRRRDLALALSNRFEPLSITDILNLTPHIIRAYANKNIRTLQRDLQFLVDAKLVMRSGPPAHALYQANRSRILQFLPPRREIT